MGSPCDDSPFLISPLLPLFASLPLLPSSSLSASASTSLPLFAGDRFRFYNYYVRGRLRGEGNPDIAVVGAGGNSGERVGAVVEGRGAANNKEVPEPGVRDVWDALVRLRLIQRQKKQN